MPERTAEEIEKMKAWGADMADALGEAEVPSVEPSYHAEPVNWYQANVNWQANIAQAVTEKAATDLEATNA